MANEAGIPVTIENFAMDGLDDPGDYIASVACEYDKIGEAAIKWIAEQDPEQRSSSALARKAQVFTRSTRKALTAPWKSWAAMCRSLLRCTLTG